MNLKNIIALLTLIVFFGCGTTEKRSGVKWPYGVKYEVFVMSFADGDGNGKGDFKGLTSKIDYFKELGVNGIWLMPIMPSDTYHKYNVNDYKNVDPDYGTLEDFKAFVEEAHRKDIKIITDFVINHTGNNHPWFLEAQKGNDNPYRNYYVWAKKDSIRNINLEKEKLLSSDIIGKWRPVNGDTLREHYYGYFSGRMPDLNLDNPKVREEIVEIARFWLKEMKVDGFRIDAAKHIFTDDRATDNHNFWIWFKEEMEKMKPDVYLVGEVWSEAREVAPYLKGLPSLFNFDLGYAITDVAKAGKDTINLVKRYKEIRDYYTSVTNDYLDATFVKNHDQTRLLTALGGDVKKAKMAAAILLTMPGTPYIYYGEEIGMVGDKLEANKDQPGTDAYIREPFIWAEDTLDRMQTSWEEPKFSSDEAVVPFTKQKDDPSSLYNFYRKIIRYRNGSPELTYGNIDHSGIQVAELVTFIRKHEGDEVLVIHNVSDVEVTLSLMGDNTRFNEIDYDSEGGKISIQENELKLPAYSTVVMKHD